MDDTENNDVFSLADIAELDSTEVQEIRFENLPAGNYGFEVIEAEMIEKDNQDGDPRVVAIFKMEVLTATALVGRAAKGIDPADLVGKSHTEKFYVVVDEGQKKALEGIGRIKAFVADIGCPNQGKVGDYVAATVGHKFEANVIERPNKNDRTSPFAALKLAKRKAPAQVAA